MADESIKECYEYYQKPKSLVTVTNKFLKSADTKLTKLMLYNLTRMP